MVGGHLSESVWDSARCTQDTAHPDSGRRRSQESSACPPPPPSQTPSPWERTPPHTRSSDNLHSGGQETTLTRPRGDAVF